MAPWSIHSSYQYRSVTSTEESPSIKRAKNIAFASAFQWSSSICVSLCTFSLSVRQMHQPVLPSGAPSYSLASLADSDLMEQIGMSEFGEGEASVLTTTVEIQFQWCFWETSWRLQSLPQGWSSIHGRVLHGRCRVKARFCRNQPPALLGQTVQFLYKLVNDFRDIWVFF